MNERINNLDKWLRSIIDHYRNTVMIMWELQPSMRSKEEMDFMNVYHLNLDNQMIELVALLKNLISQEITPDISNEKKDIMNSRISELDNMVEIMMVKTVERLKRLECLMSDHESRA